MTAALVVGLVLGGAAAVLTYVALERRERTQASRTAARLREWERIARHHNVMRADAWQVSSDR